MQAESKVKKVKGKRGRKALAENELRRMIGCRVKPVIKEKFNIARIARRKSQGAYFEALILADWNSLLFSKDVEPVDDEDRELLAAMELVKAKQQAEAAKVTGRK